MTFFDFDFFGHKLSASEGCGDVQGDIVRLHDYSKKYSTNNGGNKFVFPQKIKEINSGKEFYYYFDTIKFDDTVEDVVFPDTFSCAFKIEGKKVKNIVFPSKVIKNEFSTDLIEKHRSDKELKIFPSGAILNGCPNLRELIIPEGYELLTMKNNEKHKIEKIVLPNSIKYLENWCFNHCINLREIVLPNSIEYIGEGALASCEKLEKVNIPSKIHKIPDSAFALCKNLMGIIIPEGIETIGKSAFQGIKDTSIKIPNTVIEIKEGAFSCAKLKEVYIDNPQHFVTIERFAFNSECAIYYSNRPKIEEDGGKTKSTISKNKKI